MTRKLAVKRAAQAGRMEVARRLRDLRARNKLSLRELASLAGVAPSYISGVERNLISPTIAAMRKMLNAMGKDLGAFFAPSPAKGKACVFPRAGMRAVTDKKRRYTFIFPRRKDIKLEMLDERFKPGEKPDFETIGSDFAGYVIEGDLMLEIHGKKPQRLKTGDAFYVPAGIPIKGHCLPHHPARLITVQVPPKY